MAIWPLVDLPQGDQVRLSPWRCLGPGCWGRNSGSASQPAAQQPWTMTEAGTESLCFDCFPFSCRVVSSVLFLVSHQLLSLICAYPRPSSNLHPFLFLALLPLAVDLLLFCWKIQRRPPQYSPEHGGQTKRKNQNPVDRTIKHHSAEGTERGEASNRQIGCP